MVKEMKEKKMLRKKNPKKSYVKHITVAHVKISTRSDHNASKQCTIITSKTTCMCPHIPY